MEPTRFQIPTRDLKLFLGAAVEATRSPGLAKRLLQLCERNEAATERFRAEQHELACLRSEHERELARATKEQAERLRRERDAWDRELAQARKQLEIDENETARRKEWAAKDREAAAALRLKAERKFGPAPASPALAEAEVFGELPPPQDAIQTCDFGAGQQPTAA